MKALKVIKRTTVGNFVWNYSKSIYKHILHKREAKDIVHQACATPKHIFYCGICESSNMGDIAQTYCTLRWLERYYPEYSILLCRTSVILDEKAKLISSLQSVKTCNDMVFFQSGYNTHDLEGGREDVMHQLVINAFQDIPIIMLPQTVYFQTEERKLLCSKVYNSHKKMLFFARDPVSEKYALSMFPDLTIKLYPDIVTSMIGKKEYKDTRKKIYLCRRRDIEQYYSESELNKFYDELSKIDEVVVSDTIISASNNEILDNIEKYVNQTIEYFSKFRFVVTDKYHGLIFSLIANTPVIVLKTKDHKVTSGYEWFKKIYPDRVFYADDTNSLIEVANSILKNPNYSILDDYFDSEYYQKLKSDIDEWMTQFR